MFGKAMFFTLIFGMFASEARAQYHYLRGQGHSVSYLNTVGAQISHGGGGSSRNLARRPVVRNRDFGKVRFKSHLLTLKRLPQHNQLEVSGHRIPFKVIGKNKIAVHRDQPFSAVREMMHQLGNHLVGPYHRAGSYTHYTFKRNRDGMLTRLGNMVSKYNVKLNRPQHNAGSGGGRGGYNAEETARGLGANLPGFGGPTYQPSGRNGYTSIP